MNIRETVETLKKEALTERHVAFKLPDDTWCLYCTTEPDNRKVIEKIESDGYQVTEMIAFKPVDIQRGRWTEFKKRHAPKEVATQ